MQNNHQKIGLFGGTFNPLHMGHIESMVSIKQKLALDHIYAIPANKNPHKEAGPEMPSAAQRLEMVRRGLAEYKEDITVDEQEVVRGGESFTVDTINKYLEQHRPEDLFLITGLDEFEVFDQWKSFEEILSKVNLVVTSRPGKRIPGSVSEIPKGIQKIIAAYDRNYIELTTGRNIQFISVKDVDVSASEVRKRIRTGKNVDRYLPYTVEDFIKEEGLYRSRGDKVADYRELAEFCANQLFKNKGIMVQGFDLREIDAPCEFSLLASGTSSKHAQSLAQNVVKTVKEEYGLSPLAVEGLQDGRWVLVDYGTLIVHVFYDYVRSEYRLEELWKKGKDLGFKDPYIK